MLLPNRGVWSTRRGTMFASIQAGRRPRAGLALGGVALALLLAPQVALAHEKWFTDPQDYPVRWDLLASGPVALAALSAAAALVALLLLRRLTGDPLWPNPAWLRPVQPSAPAV